MNDRIYFSAGNFRADLQLKYLPDLGVGKVRKIFKLILSEPVRNRGAIQKLSRYISNCTRENERWAKMEAIWTQTLNKTKKI